jgi:hypothetical protein
MTDAKEHIADMKGIPTQNTLIEHLQQGVKVVSFKKTNGDKRVMTCTKSLDVIPEDNHPGDDPKAEKKLKEGLINVWDTTAQGWRSFYYDRVYDVEDPTED